MQSINPATQQVIRDYPEHSRHEVERRLSQVQFAFAALRQTSFAQRSAQMHRVADLLRQRRVELSRLITAEMGKPIVEAEAEIDKCALACAYFADHAHEMLASMPVESDAADSYVRCDPIGPVLAIMPWNFPFWQVFRFAAPALMAGNVAVLKHAPNVPGCALAIEQLFHDAEAPEGTLTALLIGIEQTASVIAHRVIRAVTLTGSVRAGRAVAAEAGRVIKKTVLELGGSDPFIVLDDVDVEQVASAAAAARCVNSGQSCIAAKRFIVLANVADRFERALVRRMSELVVGDPMDRATQVGPLARHDLRETLHEQVRRSVQAGAKLVVGGHPLERPGYFYAPTVLSGVRPGMAAFDEETFGPVAAVTPARDDNEAVHLANRTTYGLGASIWSSDLERARDLVGRIEAGNVFVNGQVKSDARLPFGGIKQSGYGRELGAPGIREFVNLKTVWTAAPVTPVTPAQRAVE